MRWFKKKQVKIEVNKLVKFIFEKDFNGCVVVSIYRQSHNNEPKPYFLYDKFQIKSGDGIYTTWNIDISKEEIIKIINSL